MFEFIFAGTGVTRTIVPIAPNELIVYYLYRLARFAFPESQLHSAIHIRTMYRMLYMSLLDRHISITEKINAFIDTHLYPNSKFCVFYSVPFCSTLFTH